MSHNNSNNEYIQENKLNQNYDEDDEDDQEYQEYQDYKYNNNYKQHLRIHNLL